jgi:hypothetical protein
LCYLAEGAAGIGVVDVLRQNQGLAQNRALNDNISLLIGYAVLEGAAVQDVIERGSPHDEGSDLSDKPVVIAVGEIHGLNRGYDTICNIACVLSLLPLRCQEES